jgi:hypothetical protein
MAPKPANQTCWAGGVVLSCGAVVLFLLRVVSFDLAMVHFLNKVSL